MSGKHSALYTTWSPALDGITQPERRALSTKITWLRQGHNSGLYAEISGADLGGVCLRRKTFHDFIVAAIYLYNT